MIVEVIKMAEQMIGVMPGECPSELKQMLCEADVCCGVCNGELISRQAISVIIVTWKAVESLRKEVL